ncbi:phosphatase PAP2 family protein [Streptomyces sp. NBC_01190]|uniref:phosphatase PAP2 family protein n=1 Tax=Streptomyces sp. NBC_01190 TaxID=2903767 RepID=UPI0038659FE6|nr:phosphatase PAP2 family protein [Streptomyces sp. NBC_01190]
MTPPLGRMGLRAITLVAGPALVFLLLLFVVWIRHGAPIGADLAIHHWVLRHRSSDLTTLAGQLTSTGTGPIPYVAAMIAGWTACPRSARPRQEMLAAAAAVAVLLTGQGVRAAVMSALARPRPAVADWAANAGGYAFPSGHTTTTALTAGLVAWSALRSGAPQFAVRTFLVMCALWAVLIGSTRVYLGVHWPTDVLGGWLLAATWLALTLPLLTRLVDRMSPHQSRQFVSDGPARPG